MLAREVLGQDWSKGPPHPVWTGGVLGLEQRRVRDIFRPERRWQENLKASNL